MAIDLVSADQFLEKAGMQAAEISNKEVIEAFIIERDLDEYIFEMIPADILRRYAEHLLNDEPISYSHLLESTPTIEKEKLDFQNLTHLAVVIMQNGRTQSVVADMALKKAYLSMHGFVLDDVCYAEKSILLTDELISTMTDALVAAELPPSSEEYQGDTSYRCYTILLLVFDDGTVQYVSRGLGSNMPASVSSVCQQLITKFVNQ